MAHLRRSAAARTRTSAGAVYRRARSAGQQPVILAEMTLHSLIPGPDVRHSDFLARADILGALGIDVLISRFAPYYRLADYLVSYTGRMIGIAVGLPSIKEIADEKYYPDLLGGVLEYSQPTSFAEMIKAKGLFRYQARRGATTARRFRTIPTYS
jgi:hypothetical protein